MASSAAPNWAALDADVLQHIMQHVPVKHRLQAAASVCTTWQQAAVAATRSIVVSNPTDAAAESLHGWLQQHGSHITSLVVKQHQRKQQLKQLPCSQLRELVMVEGDLQLAGETPDQPPLLQAAASTLTKLELSRTTVSGAQLPAALAMLRHLRHLLLDAKIRGRDVQSLLQGQQAAVVCCSSALQQLTALTHLDLRSFCHVAACTSTISSLTNLQRLAVESCWDDIELHCAGWEQLQQLTCLSLRCWTNVNREHASSLQGLTGLLELSLFDCQSLDISHLLPITQLRSIKFESVQHLADLSNWLSRQQQLTYLHFAPVCADEWGAFSEQEAQEVSRQFCVAAAQLAKIKTLQYLDMGRASAPVELWQDLFAARRQFPALTHLTGPIDMIDLSSPAYDQLLQPRDVQSMVACCPALQRLHAERVLELWPELARLEHLTDLQVAWFCDEPRGGALARLTGLRRLELHIASSWDDSQATLLGLSVDEAILSLSGMTRLSYLGIERHQGDRSKARCQHASLSTAAAVVLAGITSLLELHMPMTVVGEEQLAALAGSLSLSKLRFKTPVRLRSDV